MERLPIPDAAWLLIEGRETPMHVGGLQLFEFPDGAPRNFLADLGTSFRADVEIRPPFNNRLSSPYGRGGMFSWTRDDQVDLDYHVRHSALPKPARVRELFVLISRLHSTLLDRHRPLWESHLIEGLRGKRFAMYTKVHHSVFDGVGAMRTMQAMFSPDADERDRPPPWAIGAPEAPVRERHTDDERSMFDVAAEVLAKQAGAVGSLAGAARALGSQFISKARGVAEESIPFQAPKSILNPRITGSRRFAADDFDFERIKSVGKAYDATVNDVIMAMCAGALREYLLELDALPDQPLIAMVPVSIRQEGAGSRGNALSMLLANLATDEPDPVARIGRIKASMDRGKERLSSMNQAELVNYAVALTAPTMFGALIGTAGRGRPPVNVVISNVPGPRDPLFLNGAAMTGFYPVSLLVQGQALNITLTSYVDKMTFGITADRRSLPSVQRLLVHLEHVLAALEKRA